MWFSTFFFISIEKIKARKKILIQNEGTISGRKENRSFKDSHSSHCDPHWHIFLRIGSTRLKTISPIRKKLCVCFTSLHPLLKKEQDCKYTTQGNRLKCYCISLGYKIYQSLVLYFASYIFQNKMKIHAYS